MRSITEFKEGGPCVLITTLADLNSVPWNFMLKRHTGLPRFVEESIAPID